MFYFLFWSLQIQKDIMFLRTLSFISIHSAYTHCSKFFIHTVNHFKCLGTRNIHNFYLMVCLRTDHNASKTCMACSMTQLQNFVIVNVNVHIV